MCVLRIFVVAALMATAGWAPTRTAERVDLLLVLAADVSNSMEEQKFQLQRSGYAAAFSNPRVIEAIQAGPSGRIAVAFVEWSSIFQQKIVIDWTVISNDETARQFGDRIMEAPRAFNKNATSISAGIDFAIVQLDRAPFEARRRVIDVSGDGDNNSGPDITAARDAAVAKGITINGLVILTPMKNSSDHGHTNPLGGLADYYRNNVIGGPGAFVMVADNFNSFGITVVKKLIAEIAQAPAAESVTQRILVVEDQADNMQILRDLLTSAGYEMIEAEDGLEGVKAATAHRPDLILMDIQLPLLDGYEATRRIKADPALRAIPIIVVTSHALSGDEAKAREAGCDGYVPKPYSPRHLLAKIREYLPAS